MAVTRSWTGSGAVPVMVRVQQHAVPAISYWWVSVASLVVAAGMGAIYLAKVQRIDATQPVNLNRVASPEDLLPVLDFFPNRTEFAPKLYDFLQRARPLRNAGALTAVVSRRQLARLKPLVAVRTLEEFRWRLVQSAAFYFAGFYLVALVWRWKRFDGDRAFLPLLHLLTGFGFLLMVSIRDPLRDTLEFQKFAGGVFVGCLVLALVAFRMFDYRRLSDWCYTPLFAAMGLFGLLMAFGRGPAGNDAKVNLGPFQPIEAIRILLAMFLAGYFARNWELLRAVRSDGIGSVRLPRWLNLPRARYAVPVFIGVGAALALFFGQRDLGPALMLAAALSRVEGPYNRH